MTTKINTEEEFIKVQERITKLMETCDVNPEDDKELEELTDLMYNYEEEHHFIDWF